MADNVELQAETGTSLETEESTPLPPPTIDDIEIPPPPPEEPPPPHEEAPPPPPPAEDAPLSPTLDADTPIDLPPDEDATPPSPTSQGVPPEVDHAPVAPDEPLDAAVLEDSEVFDTGSMGEEPSLPNDFGSPLPPYVNDSGVDIPSTSTADVSALEVKEPHNDFDEIQIEGPDEQNESSSGIHHANTLPSTRSMTTPATNRQTKVNGHDDISPEDTKVEIKRVSTYRREAIMWVTIFLLIAGAIAVIFYFTLNITLLSDASLPNGEFRIRAVVILDYPWEEDLAISSTSEYMMVANNITIGINSTYTDQSSAFKDVFQGAEMLYFSNEDDDTRVSFQCSFSGAPSDDISTRPAFSDLFVSELEDGFDADKFYDLALKYDEPVNVVQFTAL